MVVGKACCAFLLVAVGVIAGGILVLTWMFNDAAAEANATGKWLGKTVVRTAPQKAGAAAKEVEAELHCVDDNSCFVEVPGLNALAHVNRTHLPASLTVSVPAYVDDATASLLARIAVAAFALPDQHGSEPSNSLWHSVTVEDASQASVVVGQVTHVKRGVTSPHTATNAAVLSQDARSFQIPLRSEAQAERAAQALYARGLDAAMPRDHAWGGDVEDAADSYWPGQAWGNYCGDGSNPDNSTVQDNLDAACKRHDACWDFPDDFPCSCDYTFMKEVKGIMDSAECDDSTYDDPIAKCVAATAIFAGFHAVPCQCDSFEAPGDITCRWKNWSLKCWTSEPTTWYEYHVGYDWKSPSNCPL